MTIPQWLMVVAGFYFVVTSAFVQTAPGVNTLLFKGLPIVLGNLLLLAAWAQWMRWPI